MDSRFSFPTEVLEHIFLYLDYKELIQCSLASFHWREVVNNNKLWIALCVKSGIISKCYPAKQLVSENEPSASGEESTFDTRLSAVCYWRNHFNCFKFLERNWRQGNATLINSTYEPFYCGWKIILCREIDCIVACNMTYPLCSTSIIPIVTTRTLLDSVCIKENFLLFEQNTKLVCLKMEEEHYVEHYAISVPCQTLQHRDVPSECDPVLNFRVTEDFVVVQNLTSPCTLFFYNYKTGSFIKEIKIHENCSGNPFNCPTYSKLEACNSKIFVVYSLPADCHFILIIDYVSGEVVQRLETTETISTTVVSENFVCSVLCERLGYKLSVWNADSGISCFVQRYVSPFLFLTWDDILVFRTGSTVHLRSLIDSSCTLQIENMDDVIDISALWCKLLVVSKSNAVELWDMCSGEKLQTLFEIESDDDRAICSVWVQDHYVLVLFDSVTKNGFKSCIISLGNHH